MRKYTQDDAADDEFFCILPNNKWKMAWDILIMWWVFKILLILIALSYCNSYIVQHVFRLAYNIAFGYVQPSDELNMPSTLIEGLATFLIFAFDIWLTLHTAYFHDSEGLVRNKKRIS